MRSRAVHHWGCSVTDGVCSQPETGYGSLAMEVKARWSSPPASWPLNENVTIKSLAALIVALMRGWARSVYAGLRMKVLPTPLDLDSSEQPQISWVFVCSRASGQGVSARMLDATTRSLWDLGYHELASATHQGNDASMRWHWRNGFRLLPCFESDNRPRKNSS